MGEPIRTIRGVDIGPFRIDRDEHPLFEDFPWRVSEEVPLPLPEDDIERSTTHCDTLEEAERVALQKLAARAGGPR